MIKGKFYILGVAGNGIFSSTIQVFSESRVSQSKRWSHVAVCFYNWALQSWLVVESVYPGGVRLISLDNWITENWTKSIIEFFEYPYLSPSELLKHIGKGYSVRDIARLARERVTGVKVRLISDGGKKYCAELIADCDNLHISKILGVEPDELFPTDFQNFAISKNIPLYDLRTFINDSSVVDVPALMSGSPLLFSAA